MPLVSLWLTLLIAPAIEAACPANAQELGEEMTRAVEAYESFAFDEFGASFGEVNRQVACLEEVLDPASVARLHFLNALARWLDRDQEAVRLALLGVFAVQRDFDPGSEIAPEGGELRGLIEEARSAPPGALGDLQRGPLHVDGVESQGLVPIERYALVQRSDEQVGGLETWYLRAGGGWEALVSVAPPQPEPVEIGESATPASLPEQAPEPVLARPRSSRWLAAGAGVAVALGTASLIVAAERKGAYQALTDEGGIRSADAEEAQRAFALNYGFGIGGWTCSAAAGGLLLGAVIKGAW